MPLYEILVDGASRNNGKPYSQGSCAIVMYKNKKQIGQYVRGLGHVTNNAAEYEAVIMGVMACWFAELENPVIYSDSQLVCKQVNGEWQCRNADLYPLYLSIKEIQEVYDFRLVQVPRKEVHQADQLNNALLDDLTNKLRELKIT